MDAQCPRCCSNYQHWQRVLCIVHLASCVHKLAQEFINSWLTGMLLQELWQVATVIALGPTNGYLQHEAFDFMFSLLAMAFGNRFCVSRKGRTGGGGWVHLQGEKSMAMSGLVGHFSPPFHEWAQETRKQSSMVLEPPFLAIKLCS